MEYNEEQVAEIKTYLEVCANIVYLSENLDTHINDPNYKRIVEATINKVKKFPEKFIVGKFGSSLRNLETRSNNWRSSKAF